MSRLVSVDRICPDRGGYLLTRCTRVVLVRRRYDPHLGHLVRRRYCYCEECHRAVRLTDTLMPPEVVPPFRSTRRTSADQR